MKTSFFTATISLVVINNCSRWRTIAYYATEIPVKSVWNADKIVTKA